MLLFHSSNRFVATIGAWKEHAVLICCFGILIHWSSPSDTEGYKPFYFAAFAPVLFPELEGIRQISELVGCVEIFRKSRAGAATVGRNTAPPRLSLGRCPRFHLLQHGPPGVRANLPLCGL